MKNKSLRSYFLYGLLTMIFLGMFGLIAARAAYNPDATFWAFLPNVLRNHPNGNYISGQVFNQDNIPIAGVTIRTDDGQTAVTDQTGSYSLLGLQDTTYTIQPSLDGTTFSPAQVSVVVPPSLIQLDFTAFMACQDVIVNGGFEGSSGWEIPITEYSAAYSSAEAHTGVRSMRTGITDPGDNTFSYSSANQTVTLPSNTTSALLSFWILPQSGEVLSGGPPARPQAGWLLEASPLSGDVQYVLLLDQYGNWIDTLIWELSDSGWQQYTFDLSEYAGETIKLHFGTYNDGYGGVSALFVDDVSFQICSGGTPPPTPTPPPGGCSNLIGNPSFETTGAWDIPITAYPAAYSTAQAHTGTRSMRTGILVPADNVYSYSDFRQMVTVPTGLSSVPVKFWLHTLSGEVLSGAPLPDSTPTGRSFGETTLSGDLQYVLILDYYQNWIDTLVWQRTDTGSWVFYNFDLVRYAGRTIYLQFGTYNDGWNGLSAMFVDDVSLDNCLATPTVTPTSGPPTATSSPTNTPTATTTPGPCTELLDNTDFEADDGWLIPLTEYPAAYSMAQYHSAWHSMRTGIVLPGDNRYSYSDFRQTVSLPLGSNTFTLGMWLYPLSGETLLQPPPQPETPFFGLESLQNDVQYLLVLDSSGYWIDTLVWMLSDAGAWSYHQFNLNEYEGWTISLQFGTYNDGLDGITAMYVDDVTLRSCP